MDSIPKKIYYHDTDCGGVVYYANYLKFFEEGRTEYMAKRGIDLREWAKKGFLFVVKKTDIEYKSPARYADDLSIDTIIAGMRSASITFHQEVKRDGNLLVNCDTVLVCIDSTFRPAVMPQELVDCLK